MSRRGVGSALGRARVATAAESLHASASDRFCPIAPRFEAALDRRRACCGRTGRALERGLVLRSAARRQCCRESRGAAARPAPDPRQGRVQSVDARDHAQRSRARRRDRRRRPVAGGQADPRRRRDRLAPAPGAGDRRGRHRRADRAREPARRRPLRRRRCAAARRKHPALARAGAFRDPQHRRSWRQRRLRRWTPGDDASRARARARGAVRQLAACGARDQGRAAPCVRA